MRRKPGAKRILLCANYFLPHRDGVANYAASLAKELQQRGHDVSVLTFNTEDAPQREVVDGIKVFRLPCRNILNGTYTLPRKNKEYDELFDEVQAQKFNAIITNTRFFPMTWLGGRLALRTGAKWIHVEHGNRSVRHQNPLVSLAAWLVDQTKGRWVFRRADVTVGVAPANVAFARRLGAKKALYIPNAIDTQRFRKVKTGLRERLGIGAREKVVVFTGRLIKMKGVHDLITAMQGMDAQLIIVGDGPERVHLEERARNLGIAARFLGEQDEQGVIEALSAADLFVNPSYSEGMPTSVLEAAAMGLSIVATDVGGTAEIVGKTGLLAPGDVAGLRDAVRKALGAKRKRYDLSRFSWAAVASRFVALLEELPDEKQLIST